MFKFCYGLILLILCSFICCKTYSSTELADDPITRNSNVRLTISSNFLTHISSSLKIEDEEDLTIQENLMSFSRTLKCILKDECDDENLVSVFKAQACLVNDDLKKIFDKEKFGIRAHEIVQSIMSEFDTFYVECSLIEDLIHLKDKVEKKIAPLAVNEFLSINKDITQSSIKCTDCGYGYFKPKKTLLKKSVLECRLCHHSQSPTNTVRVFQIVELSPIDEVTELLSKISLGESYKSEYTPEKLQALVSVLGKTYTKKKIGEMAGYSQSYSSTGQAFDSMVSFRCRKSQERWFNIQKALMDNQHKEEEKIS